MSKFDYYEFTEAVMSMTELLDQEAEYLATMKIKQVGDMQRKKMELTDRIATQQSFLREEPHYYTLMSNQQVDQLRQYSTAFDKSLKNYEDELLKANSVNQILVKMIIDTIREQVRSKSTYMNFQMSDARAQKEYMPAVKFNEQI
jgi:hypothetical protein